MDNRVNVREKALRYAVRTGEAADLDFIWGVQRSEGRNLCFGNCAPTCLTECKWYYKCREISGEPVSAGWPAVVLEELTPAVERERLPSAPETEAPSFSPFPAEDADLLDSELEEPALAVR